MTTPWTLLSSSDAAPAASSPQSFFGVPVAAAEPRTELDLCFLCDCTGSMASYIAAAQQNIESIVQRIADSATADVRFALVSYRDHPPQDLSYVTKIFDFTSSMATMSGYVATMSAAGGGDGPEAVTAALSDALHLPWRPNAAKVAVLIADAPPHGLEPSGDGFPNGDPEGRDPLDIARQMAALGITCYSVGVEPVLGQYCYARDFMCALAEITGGQAVALQSATLLAEVIVNGSTEEVSLVKLQKEVEQEVRQVQALFGASAPAEQVQAQACSNLQSRGYMTAQMETDGGMRSSAPEVWQAKPGSAPPSLAAAKAELMSKLPPSSFGGGFCPSAATAPTALFGAARGGSDFFSAGPMAAPVSAPAASSTYNKIGFGAISMSQVGRMMQKMG